MTDSALASLAERIYNAGYFTGEFPLRLGGTSTEFFDYCRFQAEPGLLRDIAENLARFVPEDTEILAGPDLGGVPLVTMLGQVTGLPAAWVRKEAKNYGRCRLVEGAEVEGRRVVMVEPMIKTGNFAVGVCNQLRELGAEVTRVLCVIDWQRGAPELLAAAGLKEAALFTWGEVCDAGRRGGSPP